MTDPVAWRWGQKLLSGRVHWTYTRVKTRKTSVPMFDQAAIDAAVAAERERCAKVCEAAWYIDGQVTADEFAALVRKAP